MVDTILGDIVGIKPNENNGMHWVKWCARMKLNKKYTNFVRRRIAFRTPGGEWAGGG